MRRTEVTFNSIISVIAVALFAGCTGGAGGGNLSLSGAPTLDDASSVSLTFSNLNDKTISEYSTLGKIDNSSQIYFNTPTISIKGVCTFGVAKVAGYVDGVKVAETATCDSNLTYTWTKTFPTGTPETGTAYAIDLKPANQAGEAFNNLQAAQIVSVKVVIDDNTPAATSSGAVAGAALVGGVYQVSGSLDSGTNYKSISVSTTGPADAYKVVISGYPDLDPQISGTTVSFDDRLTEGVQKTYAVLVYDRAGNVCDNPVEEIKTKFASSFPDMERHVTTIPISYGTVTAGGNPTKYRASVTPWDFKSTNSTVDLINGTLGYSTQKEP